MRRNLNVIPWRMSDKTVQEHVKACSFTRLRSLNVIKNNRRSVIAEYFPENGNKKHII
jgi:hypothetical protein